MAEKRPALTYDGIIKELRQGHYSPVYLLIGDEAYFIDKIAAYIADNALPAEQRDFDQTVLYGLNTTAAEVSDTARHLPVVAQRQVVIVREAQLMKGIDKLEAYMKHPVASTVLVVCYKKEKPKTTKGWIGEAEKHGVLFESKKLRDYQLPPFITTYLKTRGADIEPKAAQMVSEHIGADISRIVSELDKLFLSLPEGKKHISPDFVEQQIGISKDYNIFELRDAIVRKDVMKANRIAKYFDNNPKAGNLHSVIPALFSFFQNLFAAFYCPDRRREDALASYLGLRGPWQAREYLAAMNVYNATKTMYILQKLRTMAAKSNGLDNRSATDGELMQELIFFILH